MRRSNCGAKARRALRWAMAPPIPPTAPPPSPNASAVNGAAGPLAAMSGAPNVRAAPAPPAAVTLGTAERATDRPNAPTAEGGAVRDGRISSNGFACRVTVCERAGKRSSNGLGIKVHTLTDQDLFDARMLLSAHRTSHVDVVAERARQWDRMLR